MSGWDSLLVEFAFGANPLTDPAPLTWTDVTRSFTHASTDRGRDEQWLPHSPGTATITFVQAKQPTFFLWGTTPAPGTPLRISSLDSSANRRYLFTGYVKRDGVTFDYWQRTGFTTVNCHDALGLYAMQTLDGTTVVYDDGSPANLALVAAQTHGFTPPASFTNTLNNPAATPLGTVSYTGDALTFCQLIAQTEGGAIYVAADGTTRFDTRYAPANDNRLASSQITFDDTGVAGPSYADTFTAAAPPVYSEASVTIAADPTNTAYTATDITTEAIMGPSPFTSLSNLPLERPTEAQALANRIVLTSVPAFPNPKTIRLYPRRNNAALDAALNRELRDYCTFANSAIGLGVNPKVHVERIHHELDASSKAWTCDLSFSSRDQLVSPTRHVTDFDWLVLDDATLGKLDSTRYLAW